jgi:hypothetical protein
MVRTTGLHSLPRRILRFTTPGHPDAAAACYVALLAITTTGLPPASHQDLSRHTNRLLARVPDGIVTPREETGCSRVGDNRVESRAESSEDRDRSANGADEPVC